MINTIKPRGYGVFLQDGGQMDTGMSADQMEMQGQPAPDAQGGGEDPQAIAQQFLQAFQQIPPEAQQMIIQALNGG